MKLREIIIILTKALRWLNQAGNKEHPRDLAGSGSRCWFEEEGKFPRNFVLT